MRSSFNTSRLRFLSLLAALSLGVAACNTPAPAPTESAAPETGAPAEGAAGESGVSGDIAVDGSSTVFPISEGMAEEFMAANPNARVTVGVSGTGGGFKKFCAGETDVANASRPIKQEEIDLCAQNGVEFIELPVAYDGLSVVVNPSNTWAACMTAEELGKMWEPAAEGKITKWNQVRPDFPDQELVLFAPGTDSGTYDYFVEATVAEVAPKDTKGTRGDGTFSEDDNVLVQGVESNPNSIGFFGYAYYEENKDKLKVITIKNSEGACVEPSQATIEDGSYNPLSRPLFVYVSKKSYAEKPQVKAFMQFQADAANAPIVAEAGYIPLPLDIEEKAKARMEAMTTGTIYEGGSSVGIKLSEKL
jgi:phosphate transport system substrate-binding protein